MSDREIERLARLLAGQQAQIDGLMRTQQVSRTVVGGVPVEDRLAQAADTADRLGGLGQDVTRLDDGSGLAAWDAVQRVPVADDYLDDLSQRQDEASDALIGLDEWRDEKYEDDEAAAVDFEGIKADVHQAEQNVKEAQEVANKAAEDVLAAAQEAHDALVKANAAVAATVDEFAIGSQTDPPTSGWSIVPPVWVDGSWIWRRTTLVFGGGSTEVGEPILTTGPSGADGAPGNGVASTAVTYQAGVSGTVAPTGVWTGAVPTVSAGQYLWTRTVTTYTDATTNTSYSVGRMGENGPPGSQGVSVATLTRFYYLSASQPAAPTASPPPAPWMTTEPAYSPGSSANLYEVTRTILSSGAWSYGPVSMSAAFTAAKQAFDQANSARFLAEGLYQAIPSVDAPTSSPSGALKQGDLWFQVGDPDSGNAGRFIGVHVWDGFKWEPREALYDSILVVSEDGTVRIADNTVTAGAIAADALDFITARGVQLFSGYIEAPTIASSANLGTGANLLNDPEFTSTVNTAWVVSGHTGDAAKSQRDNYVWDQTWQKAGIIGGSDTMRNWGDASAVLTLTPGVRQTGSIVFANYSWLNAGQRDLSNPYTFTNEDTWTMFSKQLGGASDPSLKVNHRMPGDGIPRTTYLTNSATIPVQAGQKWNIRLGFGRLTSDEASLVVDASVQILNAANSAVLIEVPISKNAMQAGQVNAWWECTFTGNIRYRIKTVYTAAGGGTKTGQTAWRPKMMRSATTASRAYQSRNGTTETSWSGSASNPWPYNGGPSGVSSDPTRWMPGGSWAGRYQARAFFAWTVHTAVFAQVEAQKGWRLTETDGFELFNSNGAKTGQIDGQNNFLAGRFATAESGARWELLGDQLGLYDATNTLRGGLRRYGNAFQLFGAYSFDTDRDWFNLSLQAGFVFGTQGKARARIRGGVMYVSFTNIRRSSGTGQANMLDVSAYGTPGEDVPGMFINGATMFVQLTSAGTLRAAWATGIDYSGNFSFAIT